jgi:hypothetical protein
MSVTVSRAFWITGVKLHKACLMSSGMECLAACSLSPFQEKFKQIQGFKTFAARRASKSFNGSRGDVFSKETKWTI